MPFSSLKKFYWRFSQLYWRFSIFIGEKISLLAISTYLLAKIKFYWRIGNFGRFFPVRAHQTRSSHEKTAQSSLNYTPDIGHR
jgi:hypothetical protein